MRKVCRQTFSHGGLASFADRTLFSQALVWVLPTGFYFRSRPREFCRQDFYFATGREKSCRQIFRSRGQLQICRQDFIFASGPFCRQDFSRWPDHPKCRNVKETQGFKAHPGILASWAAKNSVGRFFRRRHNFSHFRSNSADRILFSQPLAWVLPTGFYFRSRPREFCRQDFIFAAGCERICRQDFSQPPPAPVLPTGFYFRSWPAKKSADRTFRSCENEILSPAKNKFPVA